MPPSVSRRSCTLHDRLLVRFHQHQAARRVPPSAPAAESFSLPQVVSCGLQPRGELGTPQSVSRRSRCFTGIMLFASLDCLRLPPSIVFISTPFDVCVWPCATALSSTLFTIQCTRYSGLRRRRQIFIGCRVCIFRHLSSVIWRV